MKLSYQILFKNLVAFLIWITIIFGHNPVIDYEAGCAKNCAGDSTSDECQYFQHTNRYVCDVENYPDCDWLDDVNTEEDEAKLPLLFSENQHASEVVEELRFKSSEYGAQNNLDKTCAGHF